MPSSLEVCCQVFDRGHSQNEETLDSEVLPLDLDELVDGRLARHGCHVWLKNIVITASVSFLRSRAMVLVMWGLLKVEVDLCQALRARVLKLNNVASSIWTYNTCKPIGTCTGTSYP